MQCGAGRAQNAIRSTEKARVHHLARRRGNVAARGTGAAVSDAGDRAPRNQIACDDCESPAQIPPAIEGSPLYRGENFAFAVDESLSREGVT